MSCLHPLRLAGLRRAEIAQPGILAFSLLFKLVSDIHIARLTPLTPAQGSTLQLVCLL